ncbi:IMP cyclohydrolase [Caproicibacter sp. BJN0012]|uniref:IMP cyclohydrolase n=1 Tax=Caproicibacter sp. BJN0012 TaxID=3110227 RepID=UPI002E11668F
MQRMNLEDYLGGNPYPGRGILLGRSEDGRNAVIAYFIMGRSENSRNRVFEEEGQGLRTKAFDESKLSDPSLIIYSPVRVLENRTVVTNGDQTDTVCEYLEAGKTFEEALLTRTFEPDAPNFTPRISGIVETENGFRFTLSILKSGETSGTTVREFFECASPADGEGRLIHTYSGDGDPLPSFAGEPVCVAVDGSIDELTHRIWNALNEDNKISLFVRFISLKTGLTETRILNKNR